MNRLLATACAAALLVSAGTAIACGSGDDDEDAALAESGQQTTAAGAPSGGGQPSGPGGGLSTSTPAPPPEPTSTTTPIATPTVAQIIFDVAGTGSGESTPDSTGLFGVVYAAADWGTDPGRNRAQVAAYINIGINERPSSSAWIQNTFRTPGEGMSPITAQISTGVSWKGVLAGNGAGGTRAAVSINLSVLESGTVIATQPVHSLEQRESVLTLGGFDDIDRADVNMQVALIPNRVYELRLTVQCDASSGLIGAVTHCVYGASDVYDEGYVEWEPRTILFVP